MDTTNVSANYRRGVMPLVLLALLRQEDMYGYQLVQELEKQSNGSIVSKEGSLYPVLYKLQEAGYISDRRVQVGKRMTRIYYHLEPAGEAHLRDLIRDYTAVSQGIFTILGESSHEER